MEANGNLRLRFAESRLKSLGKAVPRWAGEQIHGLARQATMAFQLKMCHWAFNVLYTSAASHISRP